MKAAVLYGIGDLRVTEVPKPVIKEDEVLVKIEYCGICGSDIGRIFKTGTYHFPTIPGHEFSGEVVEDESGEWLNKKVAVYPLLPCFKCESCKKEEYATCSDYSYYGSRCDGGFAEYLAVKKWNLVSVPDNVDMKVAAMCEPMAVSLHVASKVGLEKGDSVLIYGAGPIGLFAAEWLKNMGAENIYFSDILEEKLKFAEKLGFKRYESGVEVNKVIEGSGAASCFLKAINVVVPHGKIILLGNPSDGYNIPKVDYQNIMRKELVIAGTWNSSYMKDHNDFKSCLKKMSENAFDADKIISHIFPLDKINAAFSLINGKKEFYNKILIEC